MKKLIALPLVSLLSAAPAIAGSAGGAAMEPAVIAAEAASSGGADHAIFLLMTVLIALGIQ
ncbi:MAG: hypothetical protein ACRBBS_12455 [Thalassovita sp.]